MEVWCLGALLLVLSFANYRIERSVLYPPFAFCFLWFFILAIYQSGLVELDPLHSETIFLLGAGSVAFTAGGACAKLLPKRLIALKLKLWSPAPEKASSFKKLLTFCVIVGTLMIAANTVRLGFGGAGGLLANARQATVDARQGNVASFSVLDYVPILSIFCCTLFLTEKRDKWFWISASAACLTEILTTGRTPILQLFSLLIAVQLIKTHRTRLLAAVRFLHWPVLLFLLLFTALIFFDKKMSDVGGDVFAAISTFVLAYFVLPTAALNYVVRNAPYYGTAPHHTFKVFLEAGSMLGMWNYTPPPLIDTFVWVPLGANVYTGYKFYFTDFGFWGCVIAVGLISFFQTILYRRAVAGNEFSLYLFAITVFPLVMFVFDDLYSEFGQLLIAIVFGCFYMAVRQVRLLPSNFWQGSKGKDPSPDPGTHLAQL